MPKCGLCHFGAKRAPTAPLERLGAFGPLGTPKNVGHVCKSAKVDFCNFIFVLSKIQKLLKVTFAFWHTCTTFFGVFGAPKRVWALETRFRATFALRRPKTIKKRRTRMKKFDFGDLGAPKRSKALKTQLCDSDPSEHQKTSYTYAKTQK